MKGKACYFWPCWVNASCLSLAGPGCDPRGTEGWGGSVLGWLGRPHPASCPLQMLMVQDQGFHCPLPTPTRLRASWGPRKEPGPSGCPWGGQTHLLCLSYILAHVTAGSATGWFYFSARGSLGAGVLLVPLVQYVLHDVRPVPDGREAGPRLTLGGRGQPSLGMPLAPVLLWGCC